MRNLRLILFAGGLIAMLPITGLLAYPLTQATTAATAEVAWAKPNIMALKRVNSLSPHQSEPDYLSNLDWSDC